MENSKSIEENSEAKWVYLDSQGVQGPFPTDQIKALLVKNDINGSTTGPRSVWEPDEEPDEKKQGWALLQTYFNKSPVPPEERPDPVVQTTRIIHGRNGKGGFCAITRTSMHGLFLLQPVPEMELTHV